MTIKEAFQQLANATKKGMKNPFFIMRSLNKNFSEIADKIEGGGGSSDIEYSTTERKIGKWIDGRDVFEKVIEINSSVTISTTWNNIYTDDDIKNIGQIINITYLVPAAKGVYDVFNTRMQSNYIQALTSATSPLTFSAGIILIVQYVKA